MKNFLTTAIIIIILTSFSNRVSSQISVTSGLKIDIVLDMVDNGLSEESLEIREKEQQNFVAGKILDIIDNNRFFVSNSGLYGFIDELKDKREAGKVCYEVNLRLLQEKSQEVILIDSPIDSEYMGFPGSREGISII